MTVFAIFVIISLILLGIGAILAISAAATENKTLQITAAVWISIASLATIISVYSYHRAANLFVDSAARFTYGVLNDLKQWNYSPKMLKNDLEDRLIPELYRYGNQYYPFHKEFTEFIARPTVNLLLDKKAGDDGVSWQQRNQVWSEIVKKTKAEDAKQELDDKLERKLAKINKK